VAAAVQLDIVNLVVPVHIQKELSMLQMFLQLL
jgi:hypothetical protein